MSAYAIRNVTATSGIVTIELFGGSNNGERVVISAPDSAIIPADPADINQGTVHIVAGVSFPADVQIGLLRLARDGIQGLLAQLTT